MQLHLLEEGHHHGSIGSPAQPVGNGVAPGSAEDETAS